MIKTGEDFLLDGYQGPKILMSINKLELINNGSLSSLSKPPFCFLSDESLKYQSSSTRQSLNIRLKENNVKRKIEINASNGKIYLTNKRLIFVTDSQGDFTSFVIDLAYASAIQFSHELRSPWFGPNYWQFLFFSEPTAKILTDGFSPGEWFVGEIRFKDGGIFDFVRTFNDVILNSSIDDELPRYESE